MPFKKIIIDSTSDDALEFKELRANVFSIKRTSTNTDAEKNTDFESTTGWTWPNSTGVFRFRFNTNGKGLYNAVTIQDNYTTNSCVMKIEGSVRAVNYDLSALGLYVDDSAASAGGVAVGFAYINSSTGAMHRRLT